VPDFGDKYELAEPGIFSARHACLATGGLHVFPGELAGHEAGVPAVRQEFRRLLPTH
jgi:hypothetical protein